MLQVAGNSNASFHIAVFSFREKGSAVHITKCTYPGTIQPTQIHYASPTERQWKFGWIFTSRFSMHATNIGQS